MNRSRVIWALTNVELTPGELITVTMKMALELDEEKALQFGTSLYEMIVAEDDEDQELVTKKTTLLAICASIIDSLASEEKIEEIAYKLLIPDTEAELRVEYEKFLNGDEDEDFEAFKDAVAQRNKMLDRFDSIEGPGLDSN